MADKVANIFIDGEIWPEEYIWEGDHATSLYRVRQQIEAAGTFARIKLNIFSPGGYCVEGWAIVDYLLSLGFPIDTLAYGQCASFGTVFHSMGETREISQHCDYVLHRPWDIFIGNDLQNEEFSAYLKKETAKLFTFYADHLGKTVDDLSALIQKEDLKLTPQETVAQGFSTGIWQPSAAASLKLSALDARKKKPTYHLSLKDKKRNPNAPTDLQSTQNNMAKMRQSLVSAANSVLAFLSGSEVKNLDNKLNDGRTLVTDSTGDTPVIGDKATIDGQPAPDGDYTLEDGTVVSVKDGAVSDVKAAGETDTSAEASVEVDELTVDQPDDTPAVKALRKAYRELSAQSKATSDKYDELERRVTPVLAAMSSKEPNMQANRQPDGNRNPQLSEREQMLAEHVAKYAKKPAQQ
ncbi:ATP-dependent Clp protease proteolytic subunit [Spirosoma sp. SC4-14]|uniref:ATP-dependent Clp protease proteolytic subunit n=1 Tax=Spirosoma sp. SC4-14 TaxID=3128900 RepID=UPI0030CD3BC8